MSDYRRNRVPGGTYFFTVNLLDRQSRLLVERIDLLRDAVRAVKQRRPFHGHLEKLQFLSETRREQKISTQQA